MKFRLICILAVLLVVSILEVESPVAAGGDTHNSKQYSLVRSPASATEKDWTIMVYMAADNELSQAGIDDINEMEVVGSSDYINIIVLADFTGNGDTRLYYIRKENKPGPVIISTAIPEVPFIPAEDPELDLSNPENLVKFVSWTVEHFPANHYALDLWGHGDGWKGLPSQSLDRGIAFDKNNKHFTAPELGSALTKIRKDSLNRPMDIIIFDACMMQMVEIASEVRDFADVMVASEDSEPGPGWPYDTVLTDLMTYHQLGAPALASFALNRYAEKYPTPEGTPNNITISAMRLSGTAPLITEVDGLGNLLKNKREWSNVSLARAQTEYFSDHSYIDLYHFACQIQSLTSDENVHNQAEAVKASIRKAVFGNIHGNGHPQANGLSIYFPINEDINPDYAKLNLAKSSSWDEFLRWFRTTPQPGR